MTPLVILLAVSVSAVQIKQDAEARAQRNLLYPQETYFRQLINDGRETILNLLTNQLSFFQQAKVVLNIPRNTGISLSFRNLTLVSMGVCESVQITDRLKLHYLSLRKFSAPLRSIVFESRINHLRRHFTTLLAKIQMNHNALLKAFQKILAMLKVRYPMKAASVNPSLTEMDRITKEYLGHTLSKVSINSSRTRNYRDFGCINNLFSTVATIKKEFDLMLLFNSTSF